MSINGVKMLPSGLVSCLVNGSEVQIVEMSDEAFCIRTVKPVRKDSEFQINLFDFNHSKYHEVKLEQVRIVDESQETFYWITTVVTDSKQYREYTQMVIRNYTKYIRLKISADDEFQEELTGYPTKLDEDIVRDFQHQKLQWFQKDIQGASQAKVHCNSILGEAEFSIVIDQPKQYEQYLTYGIEEYKKQLFEGNYLSDHWIATIPVNRLYLGNQFCHLLFPNRECLFAMMEKAVREGLEITIATTYLREEKIDEMTRLIQELSMWSKEHKQMIEIVINDYGMAELVKNQARNLVPILGGLLNKRRKDPRYPYKLGYETYVGMLAHNSLDGEEYREYLRDRYGITRYEFETCGYEIQIPSRNHTLHFPYYQTNTSQFCTLYAKCKHGNRGIQEYVTQCPRYCEQMMFHYPAHLKMIGRYNSLFGMDDSLLKNPQQWRDYRKQGIDRFVCTLL